MPRYPKNTNVGPYRLVQEISDLGGTASVFEAVVADKASDPARFGQHLALKIARNSGNNAAIYEELMKEEVRILNDFRHPGVLRVCPTIFLGKPRWLLRAEELEGAPWYFATELMRGGTLADILTESVRNRFPIAWRVELLYQIAIIIDFLHTRRFAHRDIKPDNIMFRSKPQPKQMPQPTLIDFGLGIKRRINPEIKAATVSHASPERIESFRTQGPTEIIDNAKEDVWAFGIVAYEVFNGRHPFDNQYRRTVLQQRVVHDDPDPMESDVPNMIRDLILMMLRKPLEERPNILTVIKRLEMAVEYLPPRFEM